MKKTLILFSFLAMGIACSKDENPAPVITECAHTEYQGNITCGPGYVAVPGGCCPSTNPWYCGNTGTCYLYCSDAKAACGDDVWKARI